MKLSAQLQAQGFALADVREEDYDDYYRVKEACYRVYVDEYFGGWVEEVQRGMNATQFAQARQCSCFQKILLRGKTVGFFAFDEREDRIDGITIQMLEQARNHGLGSWYLEQITARGKPIELKVFKSNPAQQLYARFGFVTYEETDTHYLMRCEIGANMVRP